ncbi:hypothetical protein JDW19_02435 [Paenibacillus polymyxa]|uniref:Uncharacterized protein n=1 Tax=Paenibacillus polymyxa TaxID=1406 RepID=A0A8I1J1W3_PAEPO|nr:MULTISPECIES: hypothetical protein [Paenibacillus]KAF6576569.1 hypothetical protein G9G53_01260 [Paenibacillus sp. EKM206P]KAF6591297.1 hypothetical protein G9G52_02705 [Paenibacillus sp. EKM205P]MBM0631986.1 hypothetical protein [Paenibacillus polymyxa]
MSDPIASQSEEVQQQQQVSNDDEVRAYYEAFGIQYPTPEFEGDDSELGTDPVGQDDPAIDDPATEPELKGIPVKYNGQETVVPDDEVRGYVEKGMNYDKIKDRSQQYEVALNRLARQQGYKDHAELLENLDRIEQEAAQQKLNDFEQLKTSLREDAENSGIDPDLLDRYLDNHPLLQQAQEAVQRSQQEQEYRKQEELQQKQLAGWQMLFDKYPDLAEQVDAETGTAAWMTPDMHARLERGYDPIDAYELVHRDALTAQTRKQAEQAVIKAQRLNRRAQVETNPGGSLEPQAPEELTAAFSLFGIDPKNAQKYAKNFNK